MVGLDIEYSGSRKASLSVWRHNYVEERDHLALALLRDKNEELFRNDDGTFADGEGLRLSLRDFANEEIAEDLGNESSVPAITIPSARLFRYLVDAEQCEQGPPMSRRSKHTLRPGTIKRPRSETSQEEDGSDSSDPDKREIKRHALDLEYEPSSPGNGFSGT